MIRFETAIEIPRPREAVFEFVADPIRLPDWNSAVESVTGVVGNRYAMRRTLPSGLAENEFEVTAAAPDVLTLQTLSGPTPFAYRYSFEPSAAGTRVVLHGEVEHYGVGSLLGPLAAHPVKRGVDANLRTLRNILRMHRSSAITADLPAGRAVAIANREQRSLALERLELGCRSDHGRARS